MTKFNDREISEDEFQRLWNFAHPKRVSESPLPHVYGQIRACDAEDPLDCLEDIEELEDFEESE